MNPPVPWNLRIQLPSWPLFLGWRWVALAALASGAYPLPGWYARRITDGSDEPLGLLALAAAVYLLWSNRQNLRVVPLPMIACSAALLFFQQSVLGSFPLSLGILLVATFGFSVTLPNAKPGVTALLFLSLPLMASLDFFAGYPLRLATAELSRLLLGLAGIPVQRSGTILLDHGVFVGVDPPCAGIHMVWITLFVAALQAARLGLKGKDTLLLLAVAVPIVILGNGIRSALLFFPESGRIHGSHTLHELTGLAVQGFVLAGVIGVSHLLGKPALAQHSPTESHDGTCCRLQRILWFSLLILSCAGAVLLHLKGLKQANEPAAHNSSFAAAPWPATFHGVPLILLPPTQVEQRFARAFPGKIARFRCGDAEVILREVSRPTRLLHSTADCLRASGYEIERAAPVCDADGLRWGRFSARSGSEHWQARERVMNHARTRSYTDVSSWFWEALFKPEDQPWLAVTVLRPET